VWRLRVRPSLDGHGERETQTTMLQTSVWAMADGVAASDSFADTLAARWLLHG
jgi:hypothetical protein